MAIRTSINWSVILIFGLLILGFIVAGFLVPSGSETDDGYPLNIFMWGMAGMFSITTGGVLIWAVLSNRRRDEIERTWYDAPAEILSAAETGTYINNQPRIKFRLYVRSPVHPPCEVVHKQVMPLTMLAQYSKGKTVTVKVNPENPKDILLT